MSDDEIYDDTMAVKPPVVAPKPNVKKFAAMFEQSNATAPPIRMMPKSSNQTQSSAIPESSKGNQPAKIERQESLKKFGVPIPYSNHVPQLKSVSLSGAKEVDENLNYDNNTDANTNDAPQNSTPLKIALKPVANRKLNPPSSGGPSPPKKITTHPPIPPSVLPKKVVMESETSVEKDNSKISDSKDDSKISDSKDNESETEERVTSCTGKVYKARSRLCLTGMSKCPPKPARLDRKLDFSKVIAELKNKGVAATTVPHETLTDGVIEADATDDAVQEVYDDVAAPTRPQPQRHSANRPVSLIPELTAEEEEGENYDDVCSPSNDSGIGSTTHDISTINEFEEESEVYEPLEDMPDPFTAAINLKKEEERERKEQEKREREEKKREKEKQKKLEKEKKALQKFKIDGTEPVMMDGVVRESNKGGKLELCVRTGEVVYIVRMMDNPPGKFLVKNADNKYGYVDIENIEIKQSSKDRLKMSISESLPKDDELEEDIYEETN